MIALLSQPLFHAPDKYLVILNPFSTFLTNRRCKNAKNLFMSLLNFVLSYDCAGYVRIRATFCLTLLCGINTPFFHFCKGIPYISAID